MPQNTIYVPQGYGAKLIKKNQELHDIHALYTDQFSTCAIVACISTDQLLLIHVDVQMNMEKIHEEIMGVESPDKKIILIYKTGVGEPIKQVLADYFKEKQPKLNITEKKINKDVYGIHLSFEKNLSKVSHESKPKHIIHHPREQEILYVRKISQVIGILEKYDSGKIQFKPFIIFDGASWEPLTDANFFINCEDTRTEMEMKLFKKEDPYIVLVANLARLMHNVNRHKKLFDDPESFALVVAGYLGPYLNNYDYIHLFKRNFNHAITDEDPEIDPVTEQDKKLKNNILEILKKQGDVYDEVLKLLTNNIAANPESAFQRYALATFEESHQPYLEGKHYKDIQLNQQKIRDEALVYFEKAKQDYNKKDYASAESLFSEALKKYICTLSKSEHDLAKSFYHLGLCGYRNGKYEFAYYLIQYSLILKENFTIPKPDENQLNTMRGALELCKNKLPNHYQAGKISSNSSLSL